MKVAILIFLALGALSEVCYVHKCDDDGHIKDDGVCKQAINEGTPTWYYKFCDPNYECTKSTDTTSTCIYSQGKSSSTGSGYLPGHNCTDNSECSSEVCDYDYPSQVKVCKGLGEKEICQTHTDCEPEFYCEAVVIDEDGDQVVGKCSKLLEIGKDCDFDRYKHNQCPIYAECEQVKDKSNHACTEYFSKKAGDSVQSCAKGKSTLGVFNLSPHLDQVQNNWLCDNGTCSIIADNNYICAQAQKTVSGELTECTSDTQKTSCANQNSDQYTECRCGRSIDGKAFCMPNLGDSAGQDFLNYVKNWIEIYKSQDQKCHRAYLFDKDCLQWGKTSQSILGDWVNNYYIKTYQFLHAAELKSYDKCTSRYDSVVQPYFLATQPKQCPKYECSSQKEKYLWDEDVCIYSYWKSVEEAPLYRVKECIQYNNMQSTCINPSDSDFTSLNVTCTPQEDKIQWDYHYTGYPCNQDSDCALTEGICKNGKCTGRKQAAPCSFLEGYDCSLANTCQQGNSNMTTYYNCAPSCQEGQACCRTHSDCYPGLGCNKTLSEDQGQCVKWFSFADEESVGFCPVNTRENFLCASGQCEPFDLTLDSEGKCVEAYASPVNEKFKSCTLDSDCKGQQVKGKQTWEGKTGSCQCGFNVKDTQGYCAAFLGDQEGSDFLKTFKDLLKQDLKDCPSALSYPQEDLESTFHQKMWDCYLKKSEKKWNDYRAREWEYRHSVQQKDIKDEKSCFKTFKPYYDENSILK